MTAREGRGLELEAVSASPLLWLFCSAICGANCPHRTPLNCVVFDCRECGGENRSSADNGTFFGLGGFFYDTLGTLMDLMGFIGKFHTFSAHHGC